MSSNTLVKIKRALISVSDKTGIVEFAQSLTSHNIEILSTGGTYKLLKENNIAAIEISEHTGFPEMMDGRVKTLHPKVHGGILGRRGKDDNIMREHNIDPIDMVVVNLYPFASTVANPHCSLEDAIENIDIGGPTMVRSAAKNFNDVAIVVNASSYTLISQELAANNGALNKDTRFDLSVQAFEHTAGYDGAIANYLGKKVGHDDPQNDDPQNNEQNDNIFPRTFNSQFIKTQTMRYGENPHQKAAFYIEKEIAGATIASAIQHQGKALSFNNVADTDTALETVKLFDKGQPACVIVKHANPCGVAVADSLLNAYEKAFATDKESAFGGIIAFNQELDADTANAIIERQFVEVIIAPFISDEAKAIVAHKKNVRLLSCGEFEKTSVSSYDMKRVSGGLLVQDRDLGSVDENDLKIVSKVHPTPTQIADLMFAWKVAKMVKSNAIIYAKDLQTVGVGAGQMSRVNSARIAAIKAEHAKLDVKDSVMASDAFFPFRDGIDNAAEVGISAIIQPGGSIRDEEVIAAADEAGIAMVFTSMRHFRH